MGIINRPHDRFFKESLSDPQTAGDFLRQYLPQNLLALIDLQTLIPEKVSFIEPDLQESFSDLLYKANIEGYPGYIYFLFEHKSYRSPRIALQLLKYMLNIWNRKIAGQDDKLPVIIPLVIYHGKEPWNIPLKLSGLIAREKELPDELKIFIPDYQYLFYDLSPYGEKEIKGSLRLRIFLELLAAVLHQDYRHFNLTVKKILADFKQLEGENSEQALRYLETIIIYIMNVREDITMEDITRVSKNISLEGRERIMTLAERLLQEGIAKGMEEGRKKAAKNMLKMGLTLQKAAEAAELPLEEVLQLQKELNTK